MDNITRLERFCTELGAACERGAPLAERCTFRIGGPADLFIEPRGEQDIPAILAAAAELGVPLFTLGKGSNVLFADEGFRGAVLQIGAAVSEILLLDDITIGCGAGATLSRLCLFALENGLAGLEFAYGIPGSVGGAIYMNAGAYGGEIKDVLLRSRHVGPKGAGFLEGDDLGFGYRRSAYTGSDKVITGGVFRLEKGDPAAIRSRMDDYMSRRRSKQPLDIPSAGSTFKRPEGAYASALIDKCGLKGRIVGGAMVSEKHAGFVVNAGGATCADVLALIDIVRREVLEKTGFNLECEVRVIT